MKNFMLPRALIGWGMIVISLPSVAVVDFSPHGKLDFKLRADYTDRDFPIKTTDNTIYIKAGLSISQAISQRFSIHSEIKFDPVERRGDSYTTRQRLVAKELQLHYQISDLLLFAGKFDTGFGGAKSLVSDIYADAPPKLYELNEKVGFGFRYTLDTEALGQHLLHASAFRADRSALSAPLFSASEPRELSDGGVGNTPGFNSYALILKGHSIPAAQGFGYQVGLSHQAASPTDMVDEDAISTTVYYQSPGHYFYLLEYTRMKGFRGQEHDLSIVTSSVQAENGPWRWEASVSTIDQDNISDETLQDWQLVLSSRYRFTNGIDLNLGWRRASDGSDSFGVYIKTEFLF